MKSIIALSLLTFPVFGQLKIGQTYDYIKSSYIDGALLENKVGDIIYLSAISKDIDVHYFFDAKEKICNTVAYKPKTDSIEMDLIRQNNILYTFIKKDRWIKKINKEGILTVELKEDPDFGRVYVYKIN